MLNKTFVSLAGSAGFQEGISLAQERSGSLAFAQAAGGIPTYSSKMELLSDLEHSRKQCYDFYRHIDDIFHPTASS